MKLFVDITTSLENILQVYKIYIKEEVGTSHFVDKLKLVNLLKTNEFKNLNKDKWLDAMFDIIEQENNGIVLEEIIKGIPHELHTNFIKLYKMLIIKEKKSDDKQKEVLKKLRISIIPANSGNSYNDYLKILSFILKEETCETILIIVIKKIKIIQRQEENLLSQVDWWRIISIKNSPESNPQLSKEAFYLYNLMKTKSGYERYFLAEELSKKYTKQST